MNRILKTCVCTLLALVCCGTAVASAQNLILPDEWDSGLFGGSWIFYNQCPFNLLDPDPPAMDPDFVYGFRFTMLDLDPGDDFYFTGVGLPSGFGWDGIDFPVFIGDSFQGTVRPGPRGTIGSMPQQWFDLGLTKSFEIRGLPDISIDPFDPADQRIFPVWLDWLPYECGADIAMTPLPEPSTFALFALVTLGLARRRR